MMWENSFFVCVPDFHSSYWRDCPFPMVCSFFLCHKSIIHLCVDFFWALNSVPLVICHSFFFCPVLCSSKLGKVYVEAVCCHPAYLTYMQSTSWPLCWTPQFYQLLSHKPHPSPVHCSLGLLNVLANGLILSRSTYSLFSTQQQRRSF